MGKKSTADRKNVCRMIDKDLNQVKGIWLTGAKEAHKTRIPKTFWDSRCSFFVEEVPSAEERYVYKDEKGKIIGFITARRNGYILELYVKEGDHGKGVGTILFETLRGENPKFPELEGKHPRFRSSAYACNSGSVAWHVRNGFTVCGLMFCPHTGLPKVELIWEREDDCAN
jgi:hypothetical protein